MVVGTLVRGSEWVSGCVWVDVSLFGCVWGMLLLGRGWAHIEAGEMVGAAWSLLEGWGAGETGQGLAFANEGEGWLLGPCSLCATGPPGWGALPLALWVCGGGRNRRNRGGGAAAAAAATGWGECIRQVSDRWWKRWPLMDTAHFPGQQSFPLHSCKQYPPVAAPFPSPPALSPLRPALASDLWLSFPGALADSTVVIH